MNNKGGKQTKTFLKTYLKNSWNELWIEKKEIITK